MSTVPTSYDRQATFTSFQTEPAPTVGQDLEAEFNRIKLSQDQTQSRLAEIQRDDGRLANLSVHPDALSSAVRALLSIDGDIRGEWQSGLVYNISDVVDGPDGITYLSAVLHVANVSFAVDLNAGRWLVIDSGLALDETLREDITTGAVEGPLREDLAAATAGKGTDLQKFVDPVAPAFLKTTSDILNGVPVNVRRFFSDQGVYPSMLDGSTVYDATTALQAAIAAYGENQSRRGGRLELGRGRFIVNDTLRPTSYVADNAINLEIAGEGYLSTWLDFSAMAGGKDAIVVPGDQQIKLSGFFLKGGAGVRDGIHLGRNAADGGSNSNAVSVFDLSDIRVQGCARDGFHHYNSYMGTMNRCYALANGRDGFHGNGFHTSLTHQTCYALDNVAAGFNYSGMVYSAFIGCGSDLNQSGYILSNARGTVFKSCGAEGNAQDGWFVYADQSTVDTANPLMVQECYDVRGVSLENCSGYGNNQLNAGYAGLLRISATNVHTGAGTLGDGSAHVVDVSVRDCDASNNPSGTKAIVTQQSLGGQVRYTESGYNHFPGGRTLGAGTIRRDESLIGRALVVTRTTNQSIPTSVDTSVSWEASSGDISGWVIGSPTVITIPAELDGVKVVVKFNAAFAADNTGARLAKVFKNGSHVNPLPWVAFDEADFYNAGESAVSPPIRVVAGDQFQLVVQQNTAGALNFSATLSYLSIEVVG